MGWKDSHPHNLPMPSRRRTIYACIAATVAASSVLAATVGAAVVLGGLYNVAAGEQHWQPVYSMLERAMQQSVKLRARAVEAPATFDNTMLLRGAGCYQAKCVQCHGAPGVAPGDAGKSMQPLPGPLVNAHERWERRELYWLTRNGIRMSGMPAWEHHLDESELWSLVAFIEHMPTLDVPGYERIVAQADEAQTRGVLLACGAQRLAAPPPPVGDPEVGRQALHQHACNACHTIPGVTGSQTHVGPGMQGFGLRTNIAGVLPHTAENLERWLREPHAVKPGTAMPAMGVSAQDARHIAAYLQGLR